MYLTLYVPAETFGRQLLPTASSCTNAASHLYVTDQHTKRRFLVDTGAYICVNLHSSLRERRVQTDYELFAASGKQIWPYDKNFPGVS